MPNLSLSFKTRGAELVLRLIYIPLAIVGCLAIPGLALRILADRFLARVNFWKTPARRAWANAGRMILQVLMSPARPWIAAADALGDIVAMRRPRAPMAPPAEPPASLSQSPA